MRIKMLKTTRGSEDGINVLKYEQGKIYNMSDESLLRAFIEEMQVAEEAPLSEEPESDEITDEDDGSTISDGPEENTSDAPAEDSSDSAKETATPPKVETTEESVGASDEIDDGTGADGKDIEELQDVHDANGKPFKTMALAKAASKAQGLNKTYKPIETDGGYFLTPKKALGL